MRETKTWILVLVLLAVAGVLVILVWPRDRGKPRSKEGETAFAELQIDDLAEVLIKTPEGTSTLKRESAGWVVEEFQNAPADEKELTEAIDLLKKVELRDVVSTNPAKKAIFKVDESGVEVTLRGRGGEEDVLAHFILGKPGPDFNSTYLRPADSDSVYLVGERLQQRFDKGKRTWRNRRLCDFEPEEVAALELAAGEEGEALRLEADAERNWKAVSPVVTPLDKQRVEMICRSFGKLMADEFVETASGDLAKFGLDAPRSIYKARLLDGSEQVLLVGAANEDDSRYYVQRQGKPYVYLLGKFRIRALSKKLDELKEGAAPPRPPEGFGEERGLPPGMPPGGMPPGM